MRCSLFVTTPHNVALELGWGRQVVTETKRSLPEHRADGDLGGDVSHHHLPGPGLDGTGLAVVLEKVPSEGS